MHLANHFHAQGRRQRNSYGFDAAAFSDIQERTKNSAPPNEGLGQYVIAGINRNVVRTELRALVRRQSTTTVREQHQTGRNRANETSSNWGPTASSST